MMTRDSDVTATGKESSHNDIIETEVGGVRELALCQTDRHIYPSRGLHSTSLHCRCSLAGICRHLGSKGQR